MASTLLAERSQSLLVIAGIIVISHVILYLASFQLPFFGDAIASISKPATAIYESGLRSPFNYPDSDPGHPTVIPLFIAMGWTSFGKVLWWPHLIQILFSAATAFLITLHFLRRYGNLPAFGGLFLLLLSPLFIAQASGISLQLPLTFFFILSWSLIETKRFQWLYLTLPLMMLCHLQSILLLPLLAALQLYYKRDDNPLHFTSWLPFILALFVLSGWFWIHYQEFGWITSSPNYERGKPEFLGFIANLIRSVWRLVDFGYIVLWLPLFFNFKKLEPPALWREFLLFSLLFILPLALLFVYPPAHRYFLPLLFWLPFVFAQRLSNFKVIHKALWLAIAALLLVSGNFWVYPGRCASDANITASAWYEMEKQVRAGLPEAEIYTYAPLANEGRYTTLNDKDPAFIPLYNHSIDSLPFVLRSNLNCEFSSEQLETLRNWPAKEWKKMGIYVRVYANPKISVPPNYTILPGPKGEQWVMQIKEWLAP